MLLSSMCRHWYCFYCRWMLLYFCHTYWLWCFVTATYFYVFIAATGWLFPLLKCHQSLLLLLSPLVGWCHQAVDCLLLKYFYYAVAVALPYMLPLCHRQLLCCICHRRLLCPPLDGCCLLLTVDCCSWNVFLLCTAVVIFLLSMVTLSPLLPFWSPSPSSSPLTYAVAFVAFYF